MLYNSYIMKWTKKRANCSLHYTEIVKLIVQNQTNKQIKHLCQTVTSVASRNISLQKMYF